MFDGKEIPVFAASFTVVAALLLLRRFKQNGVKDDGKRYPPSLPVLPFLGAVVRGGMTAVAEHFMRSAEKLGPVFSLTIGKRMVVVLNGYDAIFDAMVKHSEAFADRGALFTEEKVINHELRGKRSCLGEIIARQSTFLFLTSLVQRFDIRPPEGQKMIIAKVHCVAVMAPTHYEVRLIPRVKSTQG